jgi:SAM-dependent methyltransferase
MPLATLAWPASAAEAQAMPRLPLRFVRCVDCGHVYNEAFSYDAVPYSDKPNLMFNRGTAWQVHLQQVLGRLADTLPDKPVVVEVGHGDGSFLAALAALKPAGRYIGFDPHGLSVAPAGPLTYHAALFEPEVHVEQLRPDLIISRHILEHLTNPLGFMQAIAFAATCCDVPSRAFIEVPCIDRALESGRTVDFYYEHNSHFTSESFQRMLDRCSTTVDFVDHGYGGEVIFGLVGVGAQAQQRVRAEGASRFLQAAGRTRTQVQQQLATLHRQGASVAVWGGTGKAAAFINRYGLDAERFPLVVDSDPDKAGTYVPGAGQEIRPRDWLLQHPVEVVIIPAQWRAADIVEEMRRTGIAAGSVLIEHEGSLIDLLHDASPYGEAQAA